MTYINKIAYRTSSITLLLNLKHAFLNNIHAKKDFKFSSFE